MLFRSRFTSSDIGYICQVRQQVSPVTETFAVTVHGLYFNLAFQFLISAYYGFSLEVTLVFSLIDLFKRNAAKLGQRDAKHRERKNMYGHRLRQEPMTWATGCEQSGVAKWATHASVREESLFAF